MSNRLAELFVDITLRGGGKVDLIALRDKISAADKSLANNANLYQRQTGAKLTQMTQLAVKSRQLATLDLATYKSPKYMEVANAVAQEKRVRNQSQEVKNYKEMVAEHGKIHAMLAKIQDRVKPITEAMSSWQAYAMYAAGGMGVMGAVAAASPDVYDTLTLSVKLLGAEIGTIFLPAVIEAAYWIQQAAHYVRNLSPETRQQILDWAVFGLKVTVAVFAVGKLIPALIALNSAMNFLQAGGLAKGFASWVASINPATVAILAITAAVAGLAYAIHHLSTRHTNAIAANIASAHRLDQGGDMSMTDFEQIDPRIRQRYLGTNSRAARRQILDDELARNERQQTANAPAARAAPLNQANAQAAGAPFANPQGWREQYFGWMGTDFRTLFANMRGQQALAPAAEQSRLVAERARLTALRDRGVTGGGGPGGPDIASTHTAQFLSFDQGWKRIQQEAASRGPAEERLLAIQEESRNYLRDIRGNTATPGTTYIDLNQGTID